MKKQILQLLTILSLCFAFINDTVAQDRIYEARQESPNGTQLVAIYIGAENCGPCHKPENIQAIENMKVSLSKISDQNGWSFKVVGVALDWSPEVGYNFLQKNGEFDEMVIGNSWGNLAAETYIWKADEVLAMIPQVVIYKQDIGRGNNGIEFEDRYDFKRLKMNELTEWLKNGSSWEELTAMNN